MSAIKRGRVQRNSSEEEDKEDNIFGRSKKILRSPDITNRVNKNKKMAEQDEIKQLLLNMSAELSRNTAENKAIKEELIKTTSEIKDLKEMFQKKEKEWKKEKEELLNRVEQLEIKMNMQEKEKRKLNLILKGTQINGTEIKNDIQHLLENRLGIKIKIVEAYNISKNKTRDVLLAQVENMHQKQEILRNKNKFTGSNIYVENDLTVEERKIQSEIRKIGKMEKEKGKNVRIGYRKITIDGIRFNWCDKEKGVVEDDSTPKNDQRIEENQ